MLLHEILQGSTTIAVLFISASQLQATSNVSMTMKTGDE